MCTIKATDDSCLPNLLWFVCFWLNSTSRMWKHHSSDTCTQGSRCDQLAGSRRLTWSPRIFFLLCYSSTHFRPLINSYMIWIMRIMEDPENMHNWLQSISSDDDGHIGWIAGTFVLLLKTLKVASIKMAFIISSCIWPTHEGSQSGLISANHSNEIQMTHIRPTTYKKTGSKPKEGVFAKEKKKTKSGVLVSNYLCLFVLPVGLWWHTAFRCTERCRQDLMFWASR